MRFRLVLSIWLVSTWCKFSISLFMTKWVRFKIFMVTKRRNTKFRPCKPKILILACCAKSYNLTSCTFKKCSFLPYVPRRTFQTLRETRFKILLVLEKSDHKLKTTISKDISVFNKNNKTSNWSSVWLLVHPVTNSRLRKLFGSPWNALKSLSRL